MSYSSRFPSSYSSRYGDGSFRYGDSFYRSANTSSRSSLRRNYSDRTYDYNTSISAGATDGSKDYGTRTSKYKLYYLDYLNENNNLSSTEKKHLEEDELTKKNPLRDEKKTEMEYLGHEERSKQKYLDIHKGTKSKSYMDEDYTELASLDDEDGTKKTYEKPRRKREEEDREIKNRYLEREEASKKDSEHGDAPELDYSADADGLEVDEEQVKNAKQNENIDGEVDETLAKEEEAPAAEDDGTNVVEVEEDEHTRDILEIKYDAEAKRRNLDAQSVRSSETQQLGEAEEHEEISHGKKGEETIDVLSDSNLHAEESEKSIAVLRKSSKFADTKKHNLEAQKTAASRAGKIIIEQCLLKNKVADLIAKFNRSSADEQPSSWRHKTDFESKVVGKIQSTFLS